MNWQKYQEAVGKYYWHIGTKGDFRENVYIADIVTGTTRQIDALLTITEGGHTLKIVIDAKFRKKAINVRDIESVAALCNSVGGNKAVIVASNGWSSSAMRKAKVISLDLVSLAETEAYEYLGETVLEDCPLCGKPILEINCESNPRDLTEYLNNPYILTNSDICLTTFQCSNKKCGYSGTRCEDCGDEFLSCDEMGKQVTCHCGHIWKYESTGLHLYMGTSWQR